MRRSAPAVALLAAVAVVGAAVAAGPPLANVSGFDAAALIDKTCQGSFDTGKSRVESTGALQVQFGVEGNRLVAHLWHALGEQAHDQAAYAVTQGRAIDAAGFEDLGMARDLRVAGPAISYADARGTQLALRYSQGRLYGQSDPRGAHDPMMTRVANVTMLCR